uniref:Uncharacterized protein n=1 Tax=Oryza brachyantha TaxID=4533 RepID=J3MZV8_ORYBR
LDAFRHPNGICCSSENSIFLKKTFFCVHCGNSLHKEHIIILYEVTIHFSFLIDQKN